MGLFAKAAQKNKTATASKPKSGRTWVVGTDEEKKKVADAVGELVKISSEMKALKSKENIFKGVVSKYAEDCFISDFADVGVRPDTPMKVANSEGSSVSYVVQDRGGQYNLKDDQIEALSEILGPDAAQDLLYTETTIQFSRHIMAIPGVADEVERALESAVKRLMKAEVLTGDAADELIEVNQKTAFKPGTLDRAATLVGQNKTRLKQFIKAMGSSCCRYVKI